MQNTQARSRIPKAQPLDTSSARRRSSRVDRTAQIAVVGAGIVGLSVAWHLIDAGATDLVVLDRAGVGSGASGVQPGGVRQQWATRVNCEMARESVAFYQTLGERFGGLPGTPVLEPCGYLFLAHSEQALERYRASVGLQQELGIPSQLLAPREAAALVEGLDPGVLTGASYCSEDGYFDRPQAVVEAFAKAVRERGAAVDHSDVTRLEADGEGWFLTRRDAGPVRADHVVVATGYDTPALLAGLGLTVPIAREPRYLFFSDPIRERLLEPLVVSTERRFAAKHLANGRVLASDLGARGDPETDSQEWRQHVRASIEELAPRLQLVSFPLLVEGFYDVTPDHQPLLGNVEAFSGLWLAAGFSGHGFMMAPAVGRALADAISGAGTSPWLDDLSVARFDARRPLVEHQVV